MSDSEIAVTGGAGGIAVALDDLTLVSRELHLVSEVVSDQCGRLLSLDLFTNPVFLSDVTARSIAATVGAHCAAARESLLSAGMSAESFAAHTQAAVDRYARAEERARVGALVLGSATVLIARRLSAKGQRIGWFREGELAPIEAIPVESDSRVVIADLASIMTSQSLVSGRPIVRVIEIPQPDGSSAWLVQVPGTQVWDPRAGEVPHDLTADLSLMGGESAVLALAALEALERAMAESGRAGMGDPVMLSGHSLGGIAAMSIAADPTAHERFRITHVFTAGAPVAHFGVPDETVVLSLEHVDDAVPKLDLTANPDRANWTTVHREVPDARLFSGEGVPSQHGALTYRETARLASAAATGADPSLSAWAASASAFVGRPTAKQHDPAQRQRVRDYSVSRVTESRR